MSKSYLLAAGSPTPNGRLHLGHIGAQFLKLDVLKRHLWRNGDKASLLFSADAYDTPIHLASRRDGRPEEEICRTHYDGIAWDLDRAAIDYDLFLDTSAGDGLKRIRETVIGLDTVLRERKVPVSERIPYSRRTGTPLTGRLLAGECPGCGRAMRGYACDPCGLHLSPDQLVNARPADDEDVLVWREATNDFISVDADEVREYVAARDLPAVTRAKADEVVKLLLSDDRFLARWTASEPWGIGTGVPGQVYFNRILITLAEQVLFGEVTRDLLGLRRHPFEEGAGVTTVLAYGVDNLGGRLVESAALALATERYRPFDHHLVSEFYLRDGVKMATSGSNALWVSDVAEMRGFSRDALRAYMTSIATPDTEVEVSDERLSRFMPPVTESLDRVAAYASSARPAPIDRDTFALAEESLERQSGSLRLSRIDLPELWRTTERWTRRVLSGDGAGAYADLMCFAVVAYPVLPDVALQVWRRLRQQGRPERAALGRLASDER